MRTLAALILLLCTSSFLFAESNVSVPGKSGTMTPMTPYRCGPEGVLTCVSVGLPDDAPMTGALLTVDTSRNVAYLFRDGELVMQAPAATGMDKTLKKGSRVFLFRTPRGRHPVVRKIIDPVWTKPDWAFIEEGKKIPPASHPSRKARGKLGKYALDLGDGILVHGTDDPSSLGKKASHGCIRLGDKMLQKVWNLSDVGMIVYIF